MADVFISYASEDRERARVLAEGITAQGWVVWWDRNLVGGDVFDKVIEHELKSARCVIVLWSQTAVASQWVRNEAAVAVQRNVLIPVRIEEVDLPMQFIHLQTIDLFEGVSPDQILIAIRALAATERVVPPPPPAKRDVPPRRDRSGLMRAAVVVAVLLFGGAAAMLLNKMFTPPPGEAIATTSSNLAAMDLVPVPDTTSATESTETVPPPRPQFPIYVSRDMISDCTTRGANGGDGVCAADSAEFGGRKYTQGVFYTQSFPGEASVSVNIPDHASVLTFTVVNYWHGGDCGGQRPMQMAVRVDGQERWSGPSTQQGITQDIRLKSEDRVVRFVGASGDGDTRCDDAVWVNVHFR